MQAQDVACCLPDVFRGISNSKLFLCCSLTIIQCMTDAVSKIIQKLLDIKSEPPGTPADISMEEIVFLCQTVQPVFLQQPTVLDLAPPLTICGDTHGQYHDLLRIFEQNKYPPKTNYLFLGDYVDRGCQSIETVCLLFAYKIKYPENFFMLRGNHECAYVNRQFGFYDECEQRFHKSLWKTFSKVFECLPMAAIIDNRIFCVHGGLSPSMKSIDEIRALERPLDIPDKGLACDLLWSDPDPSVETWEESDRGTSYRFGVDPLEQFLKKNDFDLVCRAHQVVMKGYDFPFPSNQGLVTVFSAPNYCYDYKNDGAVLEIDEGLGCTFHVLHPKSLDEELNIKPRSGTPPRGKSRAGTNSAQK